VDEETYVAALYQSIGRFVIAFQQLENTYREIGWYVLDPERKNWPPMELRRETNSELIDKVTELLEGLIRAGTFANGESWLPKIRYLRENFHELRKYRNKLLHSGFIPIATKDEVFAFYTADAKLTIDPDTGQMTNGLGQVTAKQVDDKIVEYGQPIIQLYFLKAQVIHWLPHIAAVRRGAS